MLSLTRRQTGLLLLRLGLAIVFLWFGFSQIFDGLTWVYLVPGWLVDVAHIPPAMIVLANGAFEVLAGALLAMGFFVRPLAVLLALHLAVITEGFGFSPIGIRDFGLTIATVSLIFLYDSDKAQVVENKNISENNH